LGIPEISKKKKYPGPILNIGMVESLDFPIPMLRLSLVTAIKAESIRQKKRKKKQEKIICGYLIYLIFGSINYLRKQCYFQM
jgi:hypothetical protein